MAPVVVGPSNTVLLLDHHHLARVLAECRASKTLYAGVKADWRTLSEDEFWARMEARNWLYLYDESALKLARSAEAKQLPGYAGQ